MQKTELINKNYQSYYTSSEPIINYMVKKLDIGAWMRILEPCGGEGAFIDPLLNKNLKLSFDIYEINPESIKVLKDKYQDNKSINIFESNTLTDKNLAFASNFSGGDKYDRIIANPPYGAWVDYNKRKELKKIYPNLYVKETYTLFLYVAIKLLNAGGKLVFILPDTFLNLHVHTKLRKFILENTNIKEILLFPSNFFPHVSFGYGRLCIITLEKKSRCGENKQNIFNVICGFTSPSQIARVDNMTDDLEVYKINQDEMYQNLDHALFIADNNIKKLINNSDEKIGDVAACVTGICTGNNKRYIKQLYNHEKKPKYEIIDFHRIKLSNVETDEIDSGIKNDNKIYVPIIKGAGKDHYIKQTHLYIDWGEKAVKNYRTDKKARFQNSKYYFKEGIGVNMVKTSRLHAYLLESRIFDQSVVGVFPFDKKYTYYLLAFLNSSVATKIIKIINPSANNSAKYIEKLPFLRPSDEILEEINFYVEEVIDGMKNNEAVNNRILDEINKIEQKIDNLVCKIYGITEEEKKVIEESLK